MKEKYEQVLIALSEILVDKDNALKWKDTQLELRDEQIKALKTKLEYIESLTGNDKQ